MRPENCPAAMTEADYRQEGRLRYDDPEVLRKLSGRGENRRQEGVLLSGLGAKQVWALTLAAVPVERGRSRDDGAVSQAEVYSS